MSLTVDIKKQLGSFTLDVKFKADDGVTCLLGQSGGGKSMTLKCIAGIEKPDSGYIELDGTVLFDSKKHINLPPQKRHVGYLFQNYALFPNMTVRQNIMCGMHAVHDSALKEHKLKEIVNIFRLNGLENLRPAQLSGGQAQRVALARILVNEPRLLMLDEPFSALDTHLRDKLKIELRDTLHSYGKGVLMVTHSMEEAYDMSRRIAVIDNGSVLTVKPTKELFANPGSIPAAIITGCKNIYAARKTGPHEAEVPELGVSFTVEAELGDNLKAIGIRANYFDPAEERNSFPVEYTDETEGPFETVIRFRYKGQGLNSEPVWWQLQKSSKLQQFPSRLGAAPINILPLY